MLSLSPFALEAVNPPASSTMWLPLSAAARHRWHAGKGDQGSSGFRLLLPRPILTLYPFLKSQTRQSRRRMILSMATQKILTYKGNCHCGRYRFEIVAPEIIGAITCDCAMCVKKGYLWIIPERGAFRVIRDDSYLTEFQSASLRDKVRNILRSIIA